MGSRGLLAGMICTALFLLAVAPYPQGGRGMVAADHEAASGAGAEILRRGGNAVDAAVAAALAAGVVQPAGSGLGGGGFAVAVRPDGTRSVLDFREVAPAGATVDMFRTADGGVDSQASRQGGLAVAVPGEPRGLARLLQMHGRLSPTAVAAPAIRLASRGFEVGPHLARALQRTDFAAVQDLFSPGGAVAVAGDRVRRQDLAGTLRKWAATRGEGLMTGAGARAVAETVAGAGGVLAASDLEAYSPVEREPIVATYRGHTVITMPPPSSGGVVLAQMLGVVEGYDLASLGHNSSDLVHLVTEAMKHAYADRAHHLGDPDFVEVPVARLVSPDRIAEVRAAIWPGRTFPAERYGRLIPPPRDGGTQHISVVDGEGGAVALTTTINTGFGSGVVVEGWGLLLNNEMDDFSAAPGAPNAFGLIGNAANAVAPGKRPLSSMSPTVVLDPGGHVMLVVGASGGTFIISSVLQVICNVVDFGMNAEEAVAAPRFHHQWQPDRLVLEPGFPRDVVESLKARGHETVVIDPFSSAQAVQVVEGGVQGGSDPRKGGRPVGVW